MAPQAIVQSNSENIQEKASKKINPIHYRKHE